MTTVEHITVNYLSDIRKALAPFEISGRTRDLLLQGFTELKTQREAYNRALAELAESAENMGGYTPVSPADPLTGRHWVDDIIAKRLGGKRDQLSVVWTVREGPYSWEPYTKEFKPC